MTRYVRRSAVLAVLFSTVELSGYAQTLSNSTLSGAYFVRHIEFTTDSSNNSTDARSIAGTITFNGSGSYSFSGQQVIGTDSAASFTASGTYSVTSAGFVTLTNPQNPAININARYGTEAVIGSSTNASGNVFDLFVAIPAPASGTTYSSQTLNATYHMIDFELTGGSTAQVRTAAMTAQFNGAGSVATFLPLGHIASVSNGATQTSEEFSGTYTVSSNGAGTITFSGVSGGSTGSTALLGSASRNLYVSSTKNVILAGTPGGQDILIGVMNPSGGSSLTGRYWLGGLEIDSTGTSQDVVASASVVGAANTLLLTSQDRSVPPITPGAPTVFTETATQSFSANTNGFGASCNCGIGTSNVFTAGPTFVMLGNNNTLVAVSTGEDGSGNSNDPTGFRILVGEQIPTVSGSGVFINPQGIVNSATYAPVGDNISPGEFITIFGSGLASTSTSATALPFPTTLGNVSVSIGGTNAPIYHVESGQIICIVPYEVTGSTADIVVTSNNTKSNTVTVNVGAATPGVFAANDMGYGDGAITHANNTLVNSASPAAIGETVQMYVGGLGGLTTAVSDGNGGSIGVLDNATIQPIVLVGSALARVTYWGLTADAGLYQINFVVPNGVPGGEQSVTIASTNGTSAEVTSTVTVAIQ